MSIDQAYDLHKSGDLPAAEAAYAKVLAAEPERSDVLHLMGVLKAQSGRPAEAVELISRAIAQAPGEPDYHFNLGHALRALGRTDDATAAYREVLSLAPDHSGAPLALADLLLAAERPQDALGPLGAALARSPDRPKLHLLLGLAQQSLGEAPRAEAAFQRALELDPDLAEARFQLAETHRRAGRIDDAVTGYKATLTTAADHDRAHFRLGWALSTLGEFEPAARHLRRAAELNPALAGRAYGQLALIKRFEQDDPDLAAMMVLRDGPGLDPADGVRLDFALGKALDELDEPDAAFEHWTRGNAAKALQQPYDIEATRAVSRLMTETFDAEFLAPAEGVGCRSELPIFIVGMPRSGTSLVEQILASHPAVHGGGELTLLQELGEALLARFAEGRPTPDQIKAIPADDWRALGEAYVERLGRLAPDAERITDKEPGNVMRLALVGKALPRARIVHVLRDPMDTCFSCYRQLFRSGSAFSYDLAALGAHYRATMDIMDHWARGLGQQILTLRYEDLVAEPEGQIRRLLDFCGVPWSDDCLTFHDTRRPVDTFSLAQVRQPLFSDSLGRWRRYRDKLAPLIAALGPYGPGDLG